MKLSRKNNRKKCWGHIKIRLILIIKWGDLTLRLHKPDYFFIREKNKRVGVPGRCRMLDTGYIGMHKD
jgi:hypothetical protein